MTEVVKLRGERESAVLGVGEGEDKNENLRLRAFPEAKLER